MELAFSFKENVNFLILKDRKVLFVIKEKVYMELDIRIKANSTSRMVYADCSGVEIK